jgi:hypothetical protein
LNSVERSSGETRGRIFGVPSSDEYVLFRRASLNSPSDNHDTWAASVQLVWLDPLLAGRHYLGETK